MREYLTNFGARIRDWPQSNQWPRGWSLKSRQARLCAEALGLITLLAGLSVLFITIIGSSGTAGLSGVVLIVLSTVWSQTPKTDDLYDRSSTEIDTSKNGYTRVLIVGAGEAGRKIATELMASKEARYKVIGFIDDEPEIGSLPGINILGPRKDTLDIVDRYSVDEVIISYAPSWQQRLAECLVSNGNRDLKVRLMPGLYETMIGKPKFDQIDDIPLIDFPKAEVSEGYALVKRILDIVFSSVALVIFLPFLLLSAMAIKLTSRGPVIYSQERVGKDGNVFTIYKLRTMVQNAEAQTGPTLSVGDQDDRVTTVGRILRASRLDEIPQFFNVLRGEMSIVGPRPERPCFVAEYEAKISSYNERHRVLPGITGLAQLHGFYQTPVYTKLKYDLMYIYNPSIYQDLKIMVLTFKALIESFWHRG